MSNHPSKLDKFEEDIQFEDDSNETPPEDVFAFNELRSCADLFRLYKDDTLLINPDFQRDVVWKDTDQSRFIDSLMKNLPIPSLCFSLDAKTGRMEVIDGLQRIYTICKFLDNDSWKLSNLDDIDEDIRGKTVGEIRAETNLYGRLQNVSLPITILRCDFTKKSHSEYIFTIFRRLNTGGMKLSNQEIRNAIYAGPFNDLLKKINDSEDWAKLLQNSTGQRNARDRFKSMELILRFSAFHYASTTYSGKLVTFLNGFMQSRRNLSREEILEVEHVLTESIRLARTALYEKKVTPRISAAVLEAVLYGISHNTKHLSSLGQQLSPVVKEYYLRLLKEEAFQSDVLSESIYRKQKVMSRLKIAKEIFSGKI